MTRNYNFIFLAIVTYNNQYELQEVEASFMGYYYTMLEGNFQYLIMYVQLHPI